MAKSVGADVAVLVGIWNAWPGADSCSVSAGMLYSARDGRLYVFTRYTPGPPRPDV